MAAREASCPWEGERSREREEMREVWAFAHVESPHTGFLLLLFFFFESDGKISLLSLIREKSPLPLEGNWFLQRSSSWVYGSYLVLEMFHLISDSSWSVSLPPQRLVRNLLPLATSLSSRDWSSSVITLTPKPSEDPYCFVFLFSFFFFPLILLLRVSCKCK